MKVSFFIASLSSVPSLSLALWIGFLPFSCWVVIFTYLTWWFLFILLSFCFLIPLLTLQLSDQFWIFKDGSLLSSCRLRTLKCSDEYPFSRLFWLSNFDFHRVIMVKLLMYLMNFNHLVLSSGHVSDGSSPFDVNFLRSCGTHVGFPICESLFFFHEFLFSDVQQISENLLPASSPLYYS